MRSSPLSLAALATVAVPGLDVWHAFPIRAADGYLAAVAVDSETRQWVVRIPQDSAAGAKLEAEVAFLSRIAASVDSGELPFVVPRIAGSAPLIDGGRAVVYPRVSGNPLVLERMRPGPGAAASLGRAIAAVHSLPLNIIEDCNLPVYTAQEHRERRLAELDEAAATGMVSPTLLRRWESALENVALWHFRPVVTHTQLSQDSVIMAHGQVSGLVDWDAVTGGDPADDLAWLTAAAPADCLESIIEAYNLRVAESADRHLMDRAAFSSEFALAQWLLHGVRTGANDVIADAKEMLYDLEVALDGDERFTVTQGASTVPQRGKQRIIGDTGPITPGVSPATGHNAIPTGATPTVDAPQDPRRAPIAETGGIPLFFTPASSAEAPTSDTAPTDDAWATLTDLVIPDYTHRRPPQPYADTPTVAFSQVKAPRPDRSPETNT
ncbi:phosphotransferase [Jonesia quinghaiensis]|uniref:phosphotransferase n=1 Tax=Jonesia quinghaiensis TaxID=262806 RepID=UPI0009FFADE3|nr:phosphotransferase [Jonesia quinghaiensis]